MIILSRISELIYSLSVNPMLASKQSLASQFLNVQVIFRSSIKLVCCTDRLSMTGTREGSNIKLAF